LETRIDQRFTGHVGLESVFCQSAVFEQVYPGSTMEHTPISPESLDLRISLASRAASESTSEVELMVAIEPEEGRQPYRAKVTYLARFRFGDLPEGLTQETLIRRNAAAMLLPFVRQTIADLTGRGSAGPVLLPPINVVALLSQSEPEDQVVDNGERVAPTKP